MYMSSWRSWMHRRSCNVATRSVFLPDASGTKRTSRDVGCDLARSADARNANAPNDMALARPSSSIYIGSSSSVIMISSDSCSRYSWSRATRRSSRDGKRRAGGPLSANITMHFIRMLLY